MLFNELFEHVSTRMRSDLAAARASITHPGTKGSAIEETVRIFLRQYLPKTLDVSTGILVDSDGRQSRQLDIILSDAAKTPIFFQSDQMRVIPAECAYAAIEVKAHLDQHELENAYQNMRSVKVLTKKAFFPEIGAIRYTHNLYGQEWDNWPIHYFVFAFDSTALESLNAKLNILQGNNTVLQRIDSICVLEQLKEYCSRICFGDGTTGRQVADRDGRVARSTQTKARLPPQTGHRLT